MEWQNSFESKNNGISCGIGVPRPDPATISVCLPDLANAGSNYYVKKNHGMGFYEWAQTGEVGDGKAFSAIFSLKYYLSHILRVMHRNRII